MYLGHNYQEQCTTLTSRLTLKLEKEITLSFLNIVEVKVGDKHYQVQGLVMQRYEISREELSTMIEDLDYLHINKVYNRELCLLIAPNKDAVQAYYDMHYRAHVADRVCHKFNFFRDGEGRNEEEVACYKNKVKKELSHLQFQA